MARQWSDRSPDTRKDCLIRKVSDPQLLNIYSLVLCAADITHRIRYLSPCEIEILVPSHLEEKAHYELDTYELENRHSRQSYEEDVFVPIFKAMSVIVTSCLVFLYSVTGPWNKQSLWFARGGGDSEAILHKFELYRLVTALTLHADVVHLLSNCFFGLILLHFFLQLTGNGIGLFSLLVTATLANYINVAVHGPGHLFVGFSTAIFSVIGMLCTMSFYQKTDRVLLHFFMPIMAGLAFLALLGSSGERTDLGAHLFGLLCGLVSGNIIRLPNFAIIRESIIVQSVLATVSFLTCYLCWATALAIR